MREIGERSWGQILYALATAVLIACAIYGTRHMGLLQRFELMAYDQYFRLARLGDGELGAESGRQSRNVGFSTDFVGYAPESRRGTSSRFSSARDPLRTSPTLAPTLMR